MTDINDMLAYHLKQIAVNAEALYQRGVMDGRRQAQQTKTELLNRIDELERQNAELRKRVRETTNETIN